MTDTTTFDPNKVPQYLKQAGWPCERLNDDTFRSRFVARTNSLPLYIRVDDGGFITFAIVPFMKSPEERDRAEKLYKRLLELNQDLMMAKFCIDDDLDVVLSVEYPTKDLDPSEFNDALDVLSFYADRHHAELVRLV
jgi:hypothetical protein